MKHWGGWALGACLFISATTVACSVRVREGPLFKMGAVSSAEPPPPPEVAEPPPPEPVASAAPAPQQPEDPSDVHIVGDHLTIDHKIHFATDSDVILEDSNEILDHIATALNNHTELTTVHVIGHTDATGSRVHNMSLSKRRAAAVVAALTKRGVKQKLDAKGVGDTQKVCKDDTPECHEKNRRVEFVVEKAPTAEGGEGGGEPATKTPAAPESKKEGS